jgi:UDP-N-acetyl-D-galactosamine dehydrogenase
VVKELESFGVDVFVHDPIANAEDAMHEYGVSLVSWESLPEADAMVLAVAHNDFICMNLDDLLSKLQKEGCFIDIKSKFDRDVLANKGVRVWRL